MIIFELSRKSEKRQYGSLIVAEAVPDSDCFLRIESKLDFRSVGFGSAKAAEESRQSEKRQYESVIVVEAVPDSDCFLRIESKLDSRTVSFGSGQGS